MYALTVRQPWAWAICWAQKDIENRTRPDRRIPGQIVAIHAGLRPDFTALRLTLPISAQIDLSLGYEARLAPRGCIVAVARFGVPVRESRSPWFAGPIGWPLSEVRVLREPIPCRGAQGFWTVPPEIEAAILAQLEVSDEAR